MLSKKVLSMNVFDALRHPELVEAVLVEISGRQRQLGVMKMNGHGQLEEVTKAQAHLSESKTVIRRWRQKKLPFSKPVAMPVEMLLVAR